MNHEAAARIARQMTHHVPDVLEQDLTLDIVNQKWHHVAATIARAVCAKFEPGQKTRRSEPWEPLDPKARMFGIFDANGASAEPIAIFRKRKLAEDYLAWDRSRGDDREIWCESCIMSIERLEGECWNSLKSPETPAPFMSIERLEGECWNSLKSPETPAPFRCRAPFELSSRDLPEEHQHTSLANPPNDIYAVCARAFNTSRDDAKERLLAAMYGKTPSAARPSPEDSPLAVSLRKFQAAIALLRGLDKQLSLYVAGGTLCLMSGPSHDEEGRPLRDNMISLAGGLRISGGDW